MRRLLLVADPAPSFVRRDRDLLSRHFEVETFHYGGARDLPRLRRSVAAADVVLCWFADTHAAAAVRLARLARVPSVVITGGYDVAAEPEIGYGLFQESGASAAVRRRLVKDALETADLVVPFSHSAAREVATRARPRAMRPLWLGVDQSRYRPAGAKERAVVSVVSAMDARSWGRKNVPALVAAARALPSVKFHIVGRHTDHSRPLLADAPPNFRVTGFIEEDELVRLYQAASVYAQPSVHEGFGVSVVEAMACECVPIVSDRGSLPEVAGDVGFVIPPHDHAALAAAIEAAIATQPERGPRGRARAAEHFTPEARERNLVEALESVMR